MLWADVAMGFVTIRWGMSALPGGNIPNIIFAGTTPPGGYTKLSQKEKSIAAAKEFEADESGDTFKTVAKHKPKGSQRSSLA